MLPTLRTGPRGTDMGLERCFFILGSWSRLGGHESLKLFDFFLKFRNFTRVGNSFLLRYLLGLLPTLRIFQGGIDGAVVGHTFGPISLSQRCHTEMTGDLSIHHERSRHILGNASLP